jgi:hypothetical protein
MHSTNESNAARLPVLKIVVHFIGLPLPDTVYSREAWESPRRLLNMALEDVLQADGAIIGMRSGPGLYEVTWIIGPGPMFDISARAESIAYRDRFGLGHMVAL